MSQDPAINAAILNFCAKAGGGGTRGTITGPADVPGQPARTAEEYQWLREAMASVESPERKLKKMLTFVDEYNTVAFGGASGGDAAALRAEVLADGADKQGAAALAPTPAAGKRGDEVPVFANADEKNDYLLDTLDELSDMVEDINWAAEFTLMQGPAKVLRFLANICDLQERALGGSAVAAIPETLNTSTTGSAPTDTVTTATAPSPTGCTTATTTTEVATEVPPVFSEVTTRLCMVVAHAAQLNVNVQQAFFQLSWQTALLRLLRAQLAAKGMAVSGNRLPSHLQASPSVVAAALHACSCLCRESPANTIAFIQAGGMDVLISLLRSADAREEKAVPSPGNDRSTSSLLSSKILARIFFFATYLADSGLSAEGLIDQICAHTEVPSPVASASGVQCETTCASNAGSACPSEDPATEGSTPRACGNRAGGDSDDSRPHELMDETTQRAAAGALLALAQKSTKVARQKVRVFMPKRLREWAMINDTEDPRRMLADQLSRAD